MVRLEKSLLDRAINVSVLNKRKLSYPLRHTLRNKGKIGWIEILFNPRNQVEQAMSSFMTFAHPYLAWCTYRFHVEKSREIGIRIEDFYVNKFHKEPYYMNYMYTQYFHPQTLLERVREVAFYRKPRTIFKGFRVPDWATAEKRHGWQVDAYSRTAWENALNDFHQEATPYQFCGERLEANIVEWFRLEQWGKGLSSRYFFNEEPRLNFIRDQNKIDDMDAELYSFNLANQTPNIAFGIDTTTQEGRDKFQAIWDDLHALTPELIKKDDFLFPHEMGAYISNEPHFQRLWGYFREHTLKQQIEGAVTDGSVSAEDSAAAQRFLGANSKHLSVSNFVFAKADLRPDVAQTDDFAATDRVMTAIGMNDVPLSKLTAEDLETQFWNNLDATFNLTEIGMREELPYFVTDPSNRMKVEAIMEGRQGALDAGEETKQLA